jgi:beta-lactamase class D
MEYDGKPVRFRSWRRRHTLASAMRHSVLWYFQRIARRLGPARERAYARKLDYGNADTSSGLTSFWIGGSLAISLDEEVAFLVRLYRDQLPVSRAAMRAVRAMLIQPDGVVTNAMGAHDFAAPWPSGTLVSAKTGSIEGTSGHAARWIVGHVARGSHAWIFAANVVGPTRAAPPRAAIQLAAARLQAEGVL